MHSLFPGIGKFRQDQVEFLIKMADAMQNHQSLYAWNVADLKKVLYTEC